MPQWLRWGCTPGWPQPKSHFGCQMHFIQVQEQILFHVNKVQKRDQRMLTARFGFSLHPGWRGPSWIVSDPLQDLEMGAWAGNAPFPPHHTIHNFSVVMTWVNRNEISSGRRVKRPPSQAGREWRLCCREGLAPCFCHPPSASTANNKAKEPFST